MNLTLHLTENCNLNCKYCLRVKKPSDMSEEVLFKALDLTYFKSKQAGVCFFGGEPLLRKDLIYKALDYCDAKSKETGIPFKSKMTTNGTLLDEEFLKRAKEVDMGIGLSFDGISQDDCRCFPDGSGSHKIVEEKAKLLLKYLPYSYAMLTLDPSVADKYFESVKYLYSLGFVRILTTPAYGKKVDWTDEAIGTLREQYIKTAEWFAEIILSGKRLYLTPFSPKIIECINGKNAAEHCHLGLKQMPVDVNGKLYPCNSFIGDEDFCLGDVFNGVDYAKQIELAKRASTPKTCVDCDLVKRCTNSCGCANRMNTGNENEVSALQCTIERMTIEVSDMIGEKMFASDPERFKEVFMIKS